MRLIINDKEVIFPSSLREITLQQKIAFEMEHRPALDGMVKDIESITDPVMIDAAVSLYHSEKMFRNFAFFTGCTIDAVKECDYVDQIATIYYSCLATIQEEALQQQPESEFVFNGEMWDLAPLEDDRKFDSFMLAKELTTYMHRLSNGDWAAMLPICAAYIRKKNEPFAKELLEERSERQQLFQNLPMDIVMQVVYFLNETLDLFIPDPESSVPAIKAQEIEKVKR